MSYPNPAVKGTRQKRVTALLTDKERKNLDRYCKKWNISRSEAVRDGIRILPLQHLKQFEKRIKRRVSKILDRIGSLEDSVLILGNNQDEIYLKHIDIINSIPVVEGHGEDELRQMQDTLITMESNLDDIASRENNPIKTKSPPILPAEWFAQARLDTKGGDIKNILAEAKKLTIQANREISFVLYGQNEKRLKVFVNNFGDKNSCSVKGVKNFLKSMPKRQKVVYLCHTHTGSGPPSGSDRNRAIEFFTDGIIDKYIVMATGKAYFYDKKDFKKNQIITKYANCEIDLDDLYEIE